MYKEHLRKLGMLSLKERRQRTDLLRVLFGEHSKSLRRNWHKSISTGHQEKRCLHGGGWSNTGTNCLDAVNAPPLEILNIGPQNTRATSCNNKIHQMTP